MHERLRQARQRAGYPSARAAAIRFGWSPSTYSAHENGQNGFDTEAALTYAKAFSCDVSWLVLGDVPLQQRSAVEIIGVAYSTDKIKRLKKDLPKGEKFANLIFTVPEHCMAIWVHQDGLYPRYDNGDLIIVREIPLRLLENVKRRPEEHLLETKDGTRYLRTMVYREDRDEYELRAHNAPPIYPVLLDDIVKAWQIWSIVPTPNWGFLNEQLQRGQDRDSATARE